MRIIKDKFNSDVFGIKMGNIVDVDLQYTNEDIQQLIDKAHKAQYKHLSVKIDSNDKTTTNMFLLKGFELVDTQLMYCINNYDHHWINRIRPEGIFFREYQENDLEQIISIAKSAYILDQYHSDSRLDKSLCDKYYSEWIKNCCTGLADMVLVAVLPKNEVAGYLTLDIYKDKAVVGLAAVNERFRKKGIFTFLIDSTLRMLCEKKIKVLFYGTQLSNMPVLKTMGHFGGYIYYSKHIMHFML